MKYQLKEGKLVLDESYETTKDISVFISSKLKKEYGLTNRDVSVRKRDVYAVNISIKTDKGLAHFKEIKNIATSKQKIDYDKFSGDILSGGNTFVKVSLDWKYSKELGARIKERITSLMNDNKENYKIYKDIIIIPVNDGGVDKYRLSTKLKNVYTASRMSETPHDSIMVENIISILKEHPNTKDILKTL